jgi:hypothetical protein
VRPSHIQSTKFVVLLEAYDITGRVKFETSGVLRRNNETFVNEIQTLKTLFASPRASNSTTRRSFSRSGSKEASPLMNVPFIAVGYAHCMAKLADRIFI